MSEDKQIELLKQENRITQRRTKRLFIAIIIMVGIFFPLTIVSSPFSVYVFLVYIMYVFVEIALGIRSEKRASKIIRGILGGEVK